MPAKIDFFFDIGSSYSYLAFEILQRYTKVWNVDVEFHPVLLGAVFKLTGNSSPAVNPLKARHMLNDLSRLCQEAQVPFQPGPEFPGNTLNVMRMLRYLKKLPKDKFVNATRHYYRENFVVNTPLSSPEFVTSISPSILSAEEMEDALQNFKSITEVMKQESAEVVEKYGAFGFPWMVAQKENGETANFWGSDRLSNMAWWLGPEYPWFGPVPPKANM